MKIKFICLLSFWLSSIYVPFLAQEDKTVTLTVTGTGSTSDVAKEKALRNAIEQAFGAFISSRTEILNDELVSDQITSVASGNIRSFEILNETLIPTGGFVTTLKATVSVSKLKSFTEAKGIKAEVQGGLFAINVKQQILNENAEINSLLSLFEIIYNNFSNSFNYEIIAGNPKSLDNTNTNWEIPLKLILKANENTTIYENFMRDYLKSVSLSNEEVQSYQSLNKKIYKIIISSEATSESFYLRTLQSRHILIKLGLLMKSFQNNFIVFNENGELKKEYHTYDGQGWRYKWNHVQKFNFFDAYLNIEYFFPNAGTVVRESEVSDFVSLSELEKISAYNVKSREISNIYEKGGLKIIDSSGHGIILSMYELYEMDWEKSQISATEASIESFHDWKIPNRYDYTLLKNVMNIISDLRENHWTSEECDDSEDSSGAFFSFSCGEESECANKDQIFRSYLIRRF